jgi:hypothetical protein
LLYNEENASSFLLAKMLYFVIARHEAISGKASKLGALVLIKLIEKGL